jgi:hypothetical protein
MTATLFIVGIILLALVLFKVFLKVTKWVLIVYILYVCYINYETIRDYFQSVFS